MTATLKRQSLLEKKWQYAVVVATTLLMVSLLVAVLSESSPLEASMDTLHEEEAAQQQLRRRLPGEVFGVGGEYGPIIMLVVAIFVLSFLFRCCCRGVSLCDLLACYCLYDICCDGPGIGDFNIMP